MSLYQGSKLGPWFGDRPPAPAASQPPGWVQARFQAPSQPTLPLGKLLWLSLGLGFSFIFLVNMKFCHVFWPCSPLRFLWGSGNATKLLVAIPMFRSWKLGSHLLHELLGIGPFCSSAQAQCVVFVMLAIAITGLSEVLPHQGWAVGRYLLLTSVFLSRRSLL